MGTPLMNEKGLNMAEMWQIQNIALFLPQSSIEHFV
jgi:hypothetical protein